MYPYASELYPYASELVAALWVLLWYLFVAFIAVGPFLFGLGERTVGKVAERLVLFVLFVPSVFFMTVADSVLSEQWAVRISAGIALWCTSTYLVGLLVPRFAVRWTSWPSRKS